MQDQTEIAILGGGCFWCTEAALNLLKGVRTITPGYSGGEMPEPSYEAVCSGNTGHIEVVKVAFDPDMISFRQLLLAFFASHDPTSRDRQGADIGSQYRSAIFVQSAAQQESAEALIAELNQHQTFGAPVVTQIYPAQTFWPAESYHQDYYANHPEQGYCAYVIAPKVAKIRQLFAEHLK